MAYYVNVINCTLGGKFILEGRARVLRTIDGDVKQVDFEDGSGPIERFVDPVAQSLTEVELASYIAKLNEPRRHRASGSFLETPQT